MADNVTSKLNVPPAPHRIIAEVDSKGRRGKRW